MFNKIIISVCCILPAAMCIAQNIDIQWNNVYDDVPGVMVSNYAMAVDSEGNHFTAGAFESNADMDASAGTFSLSNSGYLDAFISKHDADGNHIWSFSIGSPASDYIDEIFVDDAGLIYVAGAAGDGSTPYTIDFDPTDGTTNYTGTYTTFFACYDQNMQLVWVRFVSGIAMDVRYVYDQEGNLYMGCNHLGTIDFDPGVGEFLNTSNQTDMVISMYSSSGDWLWTRILEDPNASDFTALHLDEEDNLYIAGNFTGAFDGDPGAGIYTVSPSGTNNDSYLLKWNALGEPQWHMVYGFADEAIRSILTVGDDVYVTGGFIGTLDFDASPATNALTSIHSNYEDGFLARYSSDGQFEFVKTFNSESHCYGMRLMPSTNGFFLNALFIGTTDLNIDAGSDVYTSYGFSGDAGLIKLNNDGAFQWAIQYSGAAYESVADVYTHADGNLSIIGSISSFGDVLPGPETLVMSAGTNTSFLQKLGACVNTSSGVSVSSCGSYTAPSGEVFSSSGSYMSVVENGPGCMDTLYIELEVLENTSETIDISACEQYSLNNETYTMSGIYNQVLTNEAGCDSLITLNLTVREAVDTTLDVSACSFYIAEGTTYTESGNYVLELLTFFGCDSIVHLNLTIEQPDTVFISETACGQYTWNDMTYTQSGEYAQTFFNSAGCDSMVFLNLTILNSSYSSFTVDACESYLWNEEVLDESGVYTATYTNNAGCDSIIELFLTIREPASTYLDVVSCSGYTSPDGSEVWTESGIYSDTLLTFFGCDSIVTINLTMDGMIYSELEVESCGSYTSPSGLYTWNSSGIYNDIMTSDLGCDSILSIVLTILSSTASTLDVTACNSYTSPSGMYAWSESGTYVDLLVNDAGCDSLITINLTIPVTDVSVENNDPTLVANLDGVSYQWLNCTDGYTVISGATGQSFTAVENGLYAVEISGVACQDTSECVEIGSFDYIEHMDDRWFKLSPNPALDFVMIDPGVQLDNSYIILRNALGEEVDRLRITGREVFRYDLNIAPGLYYVEVHAEHGVETQKLVKR